MASNTTTTSSSRRCDACRENVGLWHAAFTSECAHTFHLRCVSGIGACPSCTAPWKDAPAAAPAPPPATPFIFGSTAGLFGKTSTAAVDSSSASMMTGAFGGGHWSKPAASPFPNSTESEATSTTSSFSLGRATPSPFSDSSRSGRSLFGEQQQSSSLFGPQQKAPPATLNPFWLDSSPPAAQSSPSPPPSGCVCGVAMGPGQATVTSECAHTFHLRCFSGSVCPVCGARWRDEVTVTPSPTPPPPLNTPSSPIFSVVSAAPSSFAPPNSSSSSPPQSLFSRPAEFTFAPSESKPNKPFSSPFSYLSTSSSLFASSAGFLQPPNHFSLPPQPDLFPRPDVFTFASSTAPSFGSPDPCSSPQHFTFPVPKPSSSPAFGAASTTPSFATPDPSSSPSLFSRSASFTFAPPDSSSSSSPAFGAESTTASFEMPDPSSSPSLFSSTPSFAFAQPYPCTSPALNYMPGIPSPTSPLFSGPPSFSSTTPSSSSSATPPPSPSSTTFHDDEPVDPPAHDDGAHDAGQESGALVLKTHCEITAVARDAAHGGFAVLVHAKAPAAAAHASTRAALDLVTVLDISGSMEGTKLALVKQAMGFVIDNLGPRDRLSIVTFSDNARRIIRLTRMSDGGKALARGAMESVTSYGLTNIGDGLRVAAGVLGSRRHRNAAAGIILLSDGVDNQTPCGRGPDGRKVHADLVPVSLRRGGRCSSPVHTFGFGTDHDAAAMQTVAEETGGTFSFVENQAAVQDSFAQCIGGLLSVAVQEARVAVECLHPSVRVRAIKSGRYESSIGSDGRAASVDVGEMYADEERRFLLFLDVPVAAGDCGGVTRLIKACCTYRDAATGKPVEVSGEEAVLERPVVVAAGTAPSVEVARERFRVEAAEDIAAARSAAERGENAEAARILDQRREASAAAGLAGDARCAALLTELAELGARVADRREYEQTGRAFALAGITAHAQQRASTVQFTGTAAPPPPSSLSLFGAPAASLFGAPAASLFGASTASAFGATVGASGFVASTTPAFGASSISPFGQTAAPAFGAAPSSFSFGFATPAMQGMVESSRKTRESAPGASFITSPAVS
ncbi:unnamed protein product [Urochloa humidicola]